LGYWEWESEKIENLNIKMKNDSAKCKNIFKFNTSLHLPILNFEL